MKIAKPQDKVNGEEDWVGITADGEVLAVIKFSPTNIKLAL